MKTTFLKKGMALMFILMLATAFSINTANAQHCKKGGDGAGCKGGSGQGCGAGKFDFIPGLTKEQSDKIDKLYLDLMKECTGLNNQINEKKAHLITVTTGDKADVNEAGKTIDEMFALKAEAAKKKVGFKMAVRGMLTDDQKVIFDMKVSNCCQPGDDNKDGAKCGQGDGKGCKGDGKCGKGDGKGCKGDGKCGKGAGDGKGCQGGNPDMDKKTCPHHQDKSEEPTK